MIILILIFNNLSCCMVFVCVIHYWLHYVYCFLFLSLEKFCRYHQLIATQNVIYEELQVSIIATSKGADEKGNTSFSHSPCGAASALRKYQFGTQGVVHSHRGSSCTEPLFAFLAGPSSPRPPSAAQRSDRIAIRTVLPEE